MEETSGHNGTNGSGIPSSDDHRAAQAELRALTTAVLLQRYQFARQAGYTFGGERDEYAILGYDRLVTNRQYREEYARGGIAGRLVDVFPNATWRGSMEIVEDPDAYDPKNYTELEKVWNELDQRLQIQAKFLRVDKLAGLGTYAVLLIGAKGELDTELPRGKAEDLLYLTPFSGGGGPQGAGPGGSGLSRSTAMDADASIFEFDVDAQSPRFGLPLAYTLRRTDISSPTFARPVHWSRIIHVAENLLDDEVYGQPALERVWNLLADLRKITGGGAEAFWLRANQGVHLDVDKDMALPDVKDTLEALKAQSEAYKHQLDRWLRTKGVKATVLGSDVANFANPADAVLTQIAGSKGVPKRILVGSEMGELASSQDRENWKDQVNGRQTGYAGPYIVRALVDRLIQYGYLPTPSKGVRAYEVRWPQIQVLTEEEKADGAQKWASTVVNGEPVFLQPEIRDQWYGMAPITDEQIAEEKERQEAMAPAPPVDPLTGEPLAVDPITGEPLGGVDPITGEPLAGPPLGALDPEAFDEEGADEECADEECADEEGADEWSEDDALLDPDAADDEDEDEDEDEKRGDKKKKTFQAYRTFRTGIERALAFDPGQRRDDRGQWTSGDGANKDETDNGSLSTAQKALQAELERQSKKPVHKAKTAEEAVEKLLAGENVEIEDTRHVHTVLKALGERAIDAKAKGEEAQDWDPCAMTVKGASLFCAEKIKTEKFPHGIPRIEMPQFKSENPVAGSAADKLPRKNGEVNALPEFLSHMEASGVKTSDGSMPARKLKASQAEMEGVKVAGMMLNEKFDPKKARILVSRDGYVVDGHHTWAAAVGRDAADGNLDNDMEMDVSVIDLPMSQIYKLSVAWTKKFGMPAAGVKKKKRALGGVGSGIVGHTTARDSVQTKVPKDAAKVLNQILGGPKASSAVRKRANIDALRKVKTDDLHRLIEAYETIERETKTKSFALDRTREELKSRTASRALGGKGSGVVGHETAQQAAFGRAFGKAPVLGNKAGTKPFGKGAVRKPAARKVSVPPRHANVLNSILGGPNASAAVRRRATVADLRKLKTADLARLVEAYAAIARETKTKAAALAAVEGELKARGKVGMHRSDEPDVAMTRSDEPDDKVGMTRSDEPEVGSHRSDDPDDDERDSKKRRSASAKDGQFIAAAEHKFSTVQARLPLGIAKKLLAFGEAIPDESLAKDGREDKPHVTVKYGIVTEDAEEARQALDGEKAIELTLGKLAVFENDEHDVLYVEVSSDCLRRLNKRLVAELETEDTKSRYIAHATIAYLKPGLGAPYVGDDRFEGLDATIDSVEFRARDGERSVIELRAAGDFPGHPFRGNQYESAPDSGGSGGRPDYDPHNKGGLTYGVKVGSHDEGFLREAAASGVSFGAEDAEPTKEQFATFMRDKKDTREFDVASPEIWNRGYEAFVASYRRMRKEILEDREKEDRESEELYNRELEAKAEDQDEEIVRVLAAALEFGATDVIDAICGVRRD